MKRIYVPKNDVALRILGMDGTQFFARYPTLAVAMSDLDGALSSSPRRLAIDRFLIAFCQLFEDHVASDNGAQVPVHAVRHIIKRMCLSGHIIQIKGRTRALSNLYRAATCELGDKADIFKRAVATMYARRDRLN